MDYSTEFKKYISSHQTSLAIRVTFSVVFPPMLCYYLDAFYHLHSMPIGAALSIGALCTSLTDTPGPPHHRRNGFYVSIGLNCITALLIGFTNTWHALLALEIVVFSFLFSFISVYGTRAGSVGTLALLVLILTIDSRHSRTQIIENGLFIGLGGVWYAFLSLVLYEIFPYRLAQQAVGESIISTSRYMRIKARFYDSPDAFQDAYTALMKEQIVLQEQQTQVRELLFKTRRIVNDSTTKSRVLLMMFVDSVDLFEMILSSQQDYRFLHRQFDGKGILSQIAALIDTMADELQDIGVSVQAYTAYRDERPLTDQIRSIGEKLDRMHTEDPNPAHAQGYSSLHHILRNIKDIRDRMHRLALYSQYDQQTTDKYARDIDYNRFISHQQIDSQVFVDNLTLRSQVFRHGLRLSLAMLTGYIIAQFLPFGHGYWILLSISVILKPLFGSTRKLYFERLGGTLIGAALAGTILFYLSNGLVLMSIMIVTMIFGYSMQKRNYLIYSIFLTIFVLIAFHFLYNHDFREILRDRVVDTAIGSFIALVAGFVFIPHWSQETMFENMRKMIRANQRYFAVVAKTYTGRAAALNDFKVARKEAFVALANLSDNFQRILGEPKSKQKNVPFMHQFVVSNQMFTAHTASLAYYNTASPTKTIPEPIHYADIIRDVNVHLNNAQRLLEDRPDTATIAPPRGYTPESPLADTVTDQFEIIRTLSRDIEYAVIKYGPKATAGLSTT